VIVLIRCGAMAQRSPRGDAGPTPPAGSAHPGERSLSEGWTVLSHLLSGIFLLGGIGWGLSALTDWKWFLPAGLLLGGAASFALIYIRYLYDPSEHLPGPGGPAGPQDRKEHG
jgi:hypothetical protein